MKNFANPCVLGDLTKALAADIVTVDAAAPFSCRPLHGRTAERDTALGRFRGEIGLPNLAEFKAALNDLVMNTVLKVILDFAEVSLSRSAVGALVGFAAAMHGRNKRLYLFRPSAQVRKTLKDLGLTGFFTVLETEDDILATLVV